MTETAAERQDIEELLPWYATGRLSAAEHARVVAYLRDHPEAATGLAIAKDEAAAVIADNEALRGPAPEALDRLMRSLPAQPTHPRAAPSLLERLTDWVRSLTPGQLGLATAALITVFLAQAVTIGTLVSGGAGVYETATGPSEQLPANAVELLVGFKPEATMVETAAFLKDNDLRIVDGPRAGLFRMRAGAREGQSTDDLVERLKASPVVATVLPGR